MKPTDLARWLALGAGVMDLVTGLGLVVSPLSTLGAMRVPPPSDLEAILFLRFVGAFVGAVGAMYLWTWRALPGRLRMGLQLLVFPRLAAGGFCAATVAVGALAPGWITVAVTDFTLAAAQLWLLRKGAGESD